MTTVDSQATSFPGAGGRTMQAAVFEGPGRLAVRDVPEPALSGRDAVKIRVEAVGICGTDLHITSIPPAYPATPGTILGHEFAGRVVEVGTDVAHLVPGDRVVVNPNDYCGVCWACSTNRPNLCEHVAAIGIHVHGAFAPYWTGSAKLAYRIAEHVSPVEAAFAEMLADVLNGTRKAALQVGESAVVIGMGPIGHLFAQLLKLAGAGRIVVVETSAYRKERARVAGFEIVADPAVESVEEVVRRETGGGADLVVDAAGSALALALTLVHKGGRVLLFGVNTSARAEISQAQITTTEIRILGTWLANATFPDAVHLLESGQVRTADLVTHRFPLSNVQEGLDVLRSGQALKVVIEP